jgi:hypothetical protein
MGHNLRPRRRMSGAVGVAAATQIERRTRIARIIEQ